MRPDALQQLGGGGPRACAGPSARSNTAQVVPRFNNRRTATYYLPPQQHWAINGGPAGADEHRRRPPLISTSGLLGGPSPS